MPAAVTRPPSKSAISRALHTLPWNERCPWCPLWPCHILTVQEKGNFIYGSAQGSAPQVGSHEKKMPKSLKMRFEPGFLSPGGWRARARCAERTHGREAAPLNFFWALWQAIGEFLPRSSDDQVFHVKTKVVELLERNKNLQVYQRVSHTLSLSFTALCEGLWAAPS